MKKKQEEEEEANLLKFANFVISKKDKNQKGLWKLFAQNYR